MTDREIAQKLTTLFKQFGRPILAKSVILYREGQFELTDKSLVTGYYLKKANAVAIEIPELADDDSIAVAQLALAVGRRLERFERGRKANATRTPNSRQKIAQNAVQSRWSAK